MRLFHLLNWVTITFFLLTPLFIYTQESQPWVIHAPAGDAFTEINPEGKTIIPNGRFVTPLGKVLEVAPHPYGLTLSQDGSIAVTANCGIRPLSVSIIRGVTQDFPSVSQIPKGYGTEEGVLAAVYMGLAISPNNKQLYIAGGQEGKVFIFDLASEKKISEIVCDTTWKGKTYSSSYIGDMVLDQEGRFLYAVDQLNFRMIVIDTKSQEIVHSIPVGRYPFGITLSPDESKAYVANVGMYEYEVAYTFEPNDPSETRINKPIYKYLSEEAEKGIASDTLNVPGLGDPLSPESFSVFAIDLKSEVPTVTAKIKTGIQIGEILEEVPAVGGSSPNSVVATNQYVFVSNGNSDCITVINAETEKIEKEIFLNPDERLNNLRGMIPYGLAISPDGKRLYVAESGINAVGIIDIPSMEVLGHIPTGWFPSKLQVSRDGKKLIIANAKGYGSGPNGGSNFEIGPEGSYIGNLMKGTVSVCDIPSDDRLSALTQQVLDNNFLFRKASDPVFSDRKNNPIPLYPGEKISPIRHIVFIAKENRTYDEVFGQLEKGNGEPALARYGSNVNLVSAIGDTLKDLTIAPNHLTLAKTFAVSDNFYVDSDVSVDGQKWLIGLYPNEWAETNVVNQYGGARSYNGDTTAPGMALLGAGITPEDFNEAGSMWEHLDRNGISLFNFGLDLRITPYQAKAGYEPGYIRTVINNPVPAPLYDNSSHLFPSYNMSIPDQFRADIFIQEFEERWIGTDEQMPAFMTIRLPNDHGAGTRPDAGYPYRQSYMMDNDLALGRIVEYLSHTPYWKNMLIVITEDDAQGGVDHIDAHRSICLVISPYVKKGHVSHTHISFGSLMKTFWHILGIPYLNQYDASATDLYDFFTAEPDFTPYKTLPVDPEVFNPELALDPFDRDFDWESLKASPALDNTETMQDMSAADDMIRAKYQPFAPLIEPESKRFMDTLRVSMKNVVYDAEIRYTLDGSDPTSTSELYKEPFTIRQTTILKARAFSVYDTQSRVSQRTYTQTEILTAVDPGNTKEGLSYSYFEGNWVQLPNFSELTPDRTGIVDLPNIEAVSPRSDHWAAIFEGYIEMPEDDLYTFYLSSDDGSVLYIDNEMVVNNDGSHSQRTVSGNIGLQKGKHPFRLEYFEDFDSQSLLLEYESDKMSRSAIPKAAFSHKE